MQNTDDSGKQKLECYNCYKLIPAESKYCPYCGHNQTQRSGYTLISDVKKAEPEVKQPQPGDVYAPQQNYSYNYNQYMRYPAALTKKDSVNWVDVAKYGGVIGTILFLAVISLEFASAVYGFVYIPQMNAFQSAFPFYFITPFIVGLYVIVGPGYGVIYVLFVLVAAIAFAYVLRGSKNFFRELKPVSRGLHSSTLFLIATLVMAYYFISIVVELIMLGTGTPVTSPDFTGIPWFMDVFQFIFAPVWEEIAARVLLIGLPLLIVAAITNKSDRVWWKYLAGGNFSMTPAAVFFLIVSSVMFGLGHWLAGSGWGFWKIFPAAVAGLMMGYLFLKKGLFASIVFHFSIDSSALLVLSPSSNFGVLLFTGIVTIIWVIIGAVFFVYYLLLMLSTITPKNLLPKRVRERYVTSPPSQEAAPPAPAPPPQYTAPQVQYTPRAQIPQPYRPPQGGGGAPVMRDPHMPVPAMPGELVFGYMCSKCGGLEARYVDGKFQCVYCGHESDK